MMKALMTWTLVTAKASLTAASVSKTWEKKPSSVQAEATARSLGIKVPKAALTPEKLSSLKALFHIYMGDGTLADIADKRMKNVHQHLCQKLADVQRKGVS